jgi:hypothetical protein
MPKETAMLFYNPQSHRFYCGVDLHARIMYRSILDRAGSIVLRCEVLADLSAFLKGHRAPSSG